VVGPLHRLPCSLRDKVHISEVRDGNGCRGRIDGFGDGELDGARLVLSRVVFTTGYLIRSAWVRYIESQNMTGARFDFLECKEK
jgi:hypothetical protein